MAKVKCTVCNKLFIDKGKEANCDDAYYSAHECVDNHELWEIIEP